MIRFFRGAALALMLAPSAGTAQDYDAGLAAYEAGNFATARRDWAPLADQGDGDAPATLGLTYDFGRDVPQDLA